MRERFKQWHSKIRINKWWMIGAVSTPVFLWTVCWLWLLPDRKLQPNYVRLSQSERAALTPQHRETLVNGMGIVATVAGGVFLILNSRTADRDAETADLNGADLNGADLSSADLSGADLSGANLNGADLRYANLSGANLGGANLIDANLGGANLNGADLRYANFSGADFRHADLSSADLRYANLSGADLNCTLLRYANLSDANLSGALLFFVNSREVKNLEPLQLKAKPSPFLCNAALPSYSSHPDVNPNRDCDRIPQLLSDRYDIPLEEAQGIVDEARQHQWN
ncbi:MAG: pentapeptide repeat-containing protein [Phormidesmis sp.]